MEDSSKFCVNCGQPTGGNVPAAEQQSQFQQPIKAATAPQKKSPVKFILIGILVLAVIICAVCVVIGMSGNHGFETIEREEVQLNEPTVSPSSAGEEAALDKAYEYLNALPFSYEGLIDQLEYEGFSSSEAVYAVDNCGADWNQQALLKAWDYLDSLAFSYSGLIDQLEYEGFTYSQAVYGVDNCGADWYEEAAKMAEDYLDSMSMSRSELIEQLVFEGFSYSEAEYGADTAGL